MRPVGLYAPEPLEDGAVPPEGGLGPHGVASERPLQPESRPVKVAGDVAGGLQSVQDAGGRTGGDSGNPEGGGGNLQGTGGRNGKMKRRSLDAGTEEFLHILFMPSQAV